MRQDCDLSFRKIKPMSIHGNCDKNLVLRQQFALHFIKLSTQKKVFLNVDETWLGMTDFRRMKWRLKGTTNSVPILQMQPRISMIVGIDTLGNVYLSLTQGNSNS